MGNPFLPSDRDLLGRVIAQRYLVEGACERTLRSATYRAYHLGLDASVLLRVMPAHERAHPQACRRALALGERVSALSHAHLGRTIDVGLLADRWPFVVYDYSRGRSLSALLEHAGPLGLPRLLDLARQLASALGAVHAAGIAHGGLQLEHLWLESPVCRPESLRLLGFGLAELFECDADGPSSGVFPSARKRPGGPTPEPPARAVRGDIQAFGACLYQLATGSRPVARSGQGFDRSALQRGQNAGPPALIRGLGLLLQRCLDAQPGAGYASLAELSRDLEHLATSAAALASAPPASSPPFTTVHAPARRARVVVGEPKVIVRAS